MGNKGKTVNGQEEMIGIYLRLRQAETGKAGPGVGDRGTSKETVGYLFR